MFTDIHTHIMYNVDDGAASLEESVAMLKKEEALGVTTVVLTPHYVRNSNKYTIEEMCRKRDILQERTPLTLLLGNECYYYSGLAKDLEEGRALNIEGTNLLLVEFDFHSYTSELYNGCLELCNAGHKVILAHIERYKRFDEETADSLLNLGVLFQMNYSYVEKNLLKPLAKKSVYKDLLKSGDISFIASDAHNDFNRPPNVDVKKIEGRRLKVCSGIPEAYLKK